MNFILVMYDMYFHFMFAIFLFSGAKLRKKEIERNLYISHFFNYINYLVLLVIADGLSFKVFVSQSYVFIYNRIKLICGKICLINER